MALFLWYDDFNVIDSHKLIESGMIRRFGFAGVGMALF